MTRPGSLKGNTGKKGVSLNETLEKRLRIYALGAGAAAGVLASPSPAMAEIVYTPTNVSISSYAEIAVPITIEGTTEFKLIAARFATPSGGLSYASLFGRAGSGAAVVASGYGNGFPAALKPGSVIGPSDQFLGGTKPMADATHFFAYWGTGGPFANTANRYLGLRFALHGQTHYGWARFSIVKAHALPCQVGAIFMGYAFETVPNQPIYAGQTKYSSESPLLPASGSASETAILQQPALGLLALGYGGLDAWRKRETLEADASEQRRIV